MDRSIATVTITLYCVLSTICYGSVINISGNLDATEGNTTVDTKPVAQDEITDVPGHIPLYQDTDPEVPDTEPDVESFEEEFPAAPRYMLDLYDEYRVNSANKPSNTVRSIQPITDFSHRSGQFMFQLSCVDPEEVIVKAELHMYGRRQNKKKQQPTHRSERSMTMMTYDLNNVTSTRYALQLVPLSMRNSGGWQIYDVTRSITLTLQETEDTMRAMMAANFFWTRDNEKKVDWSSKRPIRRHSLLRHYSSIALVIFSNDTQNITLDHLNPHLNPGNEVSIIDPETGQPIETPEKLARVGSSKKSYASKHDESMPLEWGDFNDETTWVRKKRSIYDNEIPENPEESLTPYHSTYNVIIPHPSILQSKSSLKQRKYKNLEMKARKHGKSRMLPYPDEYKRKNGKGSGKRKHRKRMPRQHVSDNVFSEDWNLNNGVIMEPRECSRRRFRVDFADIGWSDWIISPKSFDAHYCSGNCQFDAARSLLSSNHATLQSLVHAVGLHPEVPAPCCTPETFSSVTLLYFDTSHNVVLKSYPRMTVESCSCR